jgi:hypothetical protein
MIDPFIISQLPVSQLGQAPELESGLVRLRQGRDYLFLAEAALPCLAVPAALAGQLAAAIAAQAGGTFSAPAVSTRQSGAACELEVRARWDAPDAVVDPEVAAAVPGIGLLRITDVTGGAVVYDRARVEPRPAAPPQAPPAPPPRPPPSAIPTSPPAAQSSGRGVAIAVVVLAVLALGAALLAGRRP